MPISRIVLTFVAGALVATDAWAQQARVMHPAAGCTATPAQLEANKKVAMAFFAVGADRVALADPSYKQHNPAFIKGALRRPAAGGARGWPRPWPDARFAATNGKSS